MFYLCIKRLLLRAVYWQFAIHAWLHSGHMHEWQIVNMPSQQSWCAQVMCTFIASVSWTVGRLLLLLLLRVKAQTLPTAYSKYLRDRQYTETSVYTNKLHQALLKMVQHFKSVGGLSFNPLTAVRKWTVVLIRVLLQTNLPAHLRFLKICAI